MTFTDTAALVASPDLGDMLTGGGELGPSVFVRSGVRSDARWIHMGPPASLTAKQIANLSSWASPSTDASITQELARGRIVLLIYGLQSDLHKLVADILKDLPALAVQLHDIATGRAT